MKKILICLLIVAIGCSTPVELTGETKEITIEAFDWGFKQTGDEVNKGDIVILKIVNTGGEHSLAIPALGVKSRVLNYGDEEVIEFTATKSGIFPYTCSVACGAGHHQMIGELIINE